MPYITADKENMDTWLFAGHRGEDNKIKLKIQKHPAALHALLVKGWNIKRIFFVSLSSGIKYHRHHGRHGMIDRPFKLHLGDKRIIPSAPKRHQDGIAVHSNVLLFSRIFSFLSSPAINRSTFWKRRRSMRTWPTQRLSHILRIQRKV